ncbi:TPA_asm: hypothetical protein [Porphyromonas phage phage029a_Kyudai3]|uniref:Uncharacterized protein n=5 Tax=Viruses TaxID=10239 RepID=A0AAT9J9A1_9CAUD
MTCHILRRVFFILLQQTQYRAVSHPRKLKLMLVQKPKDFR